jgi:uncharacterized linocin/CFP29 family protein
MSSPVSLDLANLTRVASLRAKYPVLSDEVLKDIMAAGAEGLLSKEDAAQIAMNAGTKKLTEYEQSGAHTIVCAGVQATYQDIVNAILEA